MIDTIIFDFGNVIVDYNADYIVSCFADKDEDIELLCDAVNHNWSALDEGIIEYDEYINQTKAMLPERLYENVDRLFKDWYKCMPYIEGVAEIIKSLKQNGYKLIILSNAPDYFDDVIDYFDVVQNFDAIVISGKIKMFKPNKDIYEYVLKKYDLTDENTLFIDDKTENVNSAKSCNINGLVFNQDAEKLKTDLKELLGIDL